MIRAGRFGDIPQMIGLAREALRRSKYADIANLQDGQARAVIAEAIGAAPHGRSIVLVSERHDAVEGFLVGHAAPLYCTDVLVAYDQFFYVAPSGSAAAALGLLRAFIRWAESSPDKMVIRMTMNDAITDLGQLDKMMQATGFNMTGLVYERN